MKNEERDYLLKIINIQNTMLEAHAQRNMNKFIALDTELKHMQKITFTDFLKSRADERKIKMNRFTNLLTELQSVAKEMNNV